MLLVYFHGLKIFTIYFDGPFFFFFFFFFLSQYKFAPTGAEPAAAVQHPPGGLLGHLAGPERQGPLLRLPAGGAVRRVPGPSDGRYHKIFQLDLRFDRPHGW